MYRVLLVDDEPIILTGLKFLIPWEEQDCSIVGTAANGQQALAAIENLKPDIVVADINMPVLSGIGLLEKSNELYPKVVFIMLTNLQDFELAQQALRYRAVDYIIKMQLEPENLMQSLERAKSEVQKRAPEPKNLLKEYREAERENLVKGILKGIINDTNPDPEQIKLLSAEGILSRYGVIILSLLSSTVTEWNQKSEEHLTPWLLETAFKLASGTFTNYHIIALDKERLALFVWNLDPNSYEQQISLFQKRLGTITEHIMGKKAVVLSTVPFKDQQELENCKKQLSALEVDFYLNGTAMIHGTALNDVKQEALQLGSAVGKLAAVLESRSRQGCQILFREITARIESTPHNKNDVMWVCKDLYETAAEVLGKQGDTFFGNQKNVVDYIEKLKTRKEVLSFLQLIEESILGHLSITTGNIDILERAKQYVYEHLHQRVTLQDVAESIHISSSYFSMLFKKEYGQNFINFVNETKVQKAQQMLLEGKYRISEVGDMLGFENAYYFSRVFRRYTGVSPSEFLKLQEKEEPEDTN